MPRDSLKTEPTQGLHSLARECLESAKGDETSAIKMMKARVRQNPVQLDAALDLACKTAVSEMRVAENNAAWAGQASRSAESAPAPIDLTQRGARVHALVAEHRRLLDMRLPHGVELGEAKKTDLEDAIAWYEKRIDTEAHKVRWFRAIARRIDGRRVRDVLDENQLRKLQKDTEDE